MLSTSSLESRPRLMGADAIWDQLVGELHSRRLWRDLWDRARGELPAYATEQFELGGKEMDAEESRSDIWPLQRGLRERWGPQPGDDLGRWERLGRRRAAQGVPVDEMMQMWRIYHETMRVHARDVVPEGPVRAELLLQAFEITAAWVDVAMITTAAAHRQAETITRRRTEHHRANLLRSILFCGANAADLQMAQNTYRLDLRGEFYAVRAQLTPVGGPSDFERLLVPGAGSGWGNGLVALIDGDVCGVMSSPPPASPETQRSVSRGRRQFRRCRRRSLVQRVPRRPPRRWDRRDSTISSRSVSTPPF